MFDNMYYSEFNSYIQHCGHSSYGKAPYTLYTVLYIVYYFRGIIQVTIYTGNYFNINI